jgi:hypothetical protein
MTFSLSIETTDGKTFPWKFLSKLTEDQARTVAISHFNARRHYRLPVVSVALIKDGQVWDVYDGQWATTINGWWN